MNSGHGADKSFTVRRMVGGVGVEKVFPLYSEMIKKIEVKKEAKVRRSKMYYMRGRAGKSARLKESFVEQEDLEESIEELAEQKEKEEAESPEQSQSEATAPSTEEGQEPAEKQEPESPKEPEQKEAPAEPEPAPEPEPEAEKPAEPEEKKEE